MTPIRTTAPTSPIAAILRGDVSEAAMHDAMHEALRAWNAGDQRVPVHIHLGLTEPEWKLYMEAEGNLVKILQTRRSAHLYKPKPTQPERPRRRW